METLEKIFGNAAKVKIMRLFLFNPRITFNASDIAKRTNVNSSVVRREISNLKKIGLIKNKKVVKNIQKRKRGIVKSVRTTSSGWVLNDNFNYLILLQNFLINITPFKHEDFLKKISKIGRVKLLIISGVFIQKWESRLDLLMVGDNIKKKAVETMVKNIESEIGKEIRYSVFNTPDFLYRYNMHDKLIRDVLDYPHEKVMDKLKIF